MTKRILSLFLTLLMVVTSVCVTGYATLISVAAEDAATVAGDANLEEEGEPVINYITQPYTTDQEKLNDMKLVREQNGYELYFESYTGEVAFKNTETGDVLFSNPYDIAAGYNWASASTKQKLLSQLVVTYEQNGVASTMYSYTEAAMRGQIKMKNIKNGIRVEYTVGEIATTRLVPRMISKTRFESMILNNIKDQANYDRLIAFYKLYDTSDKSLTERNVKEIQASFPITKQFAVYVCTPDITSKELQTLEKIVKTYCPNYTYEEMDQDHADCDYQVSDEAPPNFKMAIEYTIAEDGLEARLPANGIRFDESNFTLTSVTLLPYMGCGSNEYTGYNFIPDGSGSLVRFEKVKNATYNVSGQMYGTDYAYHTISGQHSEVMRYPVWGIVVDGKVPKGPDGEPDPNAPKAPSKGMTAIITEGDSMATLMSESGGKLHCYNTVYATFNPRPSDKYNLATSISVGSNSSWTVTTDRKYTGSYRIKYTLLGQREAYEASYIGMANVYRDYLKGIGAIEKKTGDSKNMPLYIEAFGTIESSHKVLSFPVDLPTELTTFEDVQKMYDELNENGVDNINFRLTGFYNSGLDNTYMAKLKWEKCLGGEKGLTNLLEYSKTHNFKVFPEFDIGYMNVAGWFDGVTEKRDIVKSIDDRYMSKRDYDAATQEFSSQYALAISPARYDFFLGKIEGKLDKYQTSGLNGVSFSTLGTDLNSDFDEDDPYNREDSKGFTTGVLQKLNDKDLSVMVNGGNAYTFGYVDHIIDMPTESSNFLNAAESIPFLAIVLHGYVDYTGSALNMEGDVQHAILKNIENGSSLFFTLAYENTSELKSSQKFNKYYSVTYDIWKDEIAEYYTELNDVLGDLQNEEITGHEFVSAYRTVKKDAQELSDEEIAAQKAQEEADAKEIERAAKRAALLKQRGEELTNSAKASTSNRKAGTGATTATYDCESGSVVKVTYEGGASFIINYNSYDITATSGGQTYEVEALSFIRVD